MMTNGSDQQLLHLLKQNKELGIRKVFETYYKPLLFYGLRFINDESEVEDIVQNIFLKFWENENLVNAKCLKSYLFGSVKNRCLNKIKNKGNILIDELNCLTEFDWIEEVEDPGYFEKINKIKTEINQLPPKTKAIFKAVHYYNHSYQNVAEDFGISVNTIKTTLRRATKILKNNCQVGYGILILLLLLLAF